MAANPNSIARKPLSIRKPETPPQPSADDALPDVANESSRHDDVARAAYYIAEARAFEPGHELDDWLAAEERIG